MTAPLVAHQLPDTTRQAVRAARREELDLQQAQLDEARSELEELARQADVHSHSSASSPSAPPEGPWS